MGRPKLTDEQKLQRKVEQQVVKVALREAKWKDRQTVQAQQAQESRDKILGEMDATRREQFEVALQYAASTANAFFRDIALSWQKYGNLSVNQIDIFIAGTKRDAHRVIAAEIIDDWYVVGEVINAKNLDVLDICQVHVETPYGHGFVTRIKMKNKAGIFFTVKTNAAKLINLFDSALENKKQVTVKAIIKWHFPDSDTIILTSRGMKVEL